MIGEADRFGKRVGLGVQNENSKWKKTMEHHQSNEHYEIIGFNKKKLRKQTLKH